jgi:hypothetical protein
VGVLWAVPAGSDAVNSGQVDLMGAQPDRNRYRLAILKHAYLAFCMKFGRPKGEVADEIRRDLTAARDAPSRQDVPQSRLALGLTARRLDGAEATLTAPAARAVVHETAGACEGVILAGRVSSRGLFTEESQTAAEQQRMRVT